MRKNQSEIIDTYICDTDPSVALIHISYPQALPCNADQVSVVQGMNARNEGGKGLFEIIKDFGGKPSMHTDCPLPNMPENVYEEVMGKAIELLSLTRKEISVFIDKNTPLAVQQTVQNATQKASAKLVF